MINHDSNPASAGHGLVPAGTNPALRSVPAPGAANLLLEPRNAGFAPVAVGPRADGLAALLHSLRRRWRLAIGVGLLCSGSAAMIAWFTWKPGYVAAAHLRVASRQPVVMFTTKDLVGQPDFEVYKNTQKELIKNRYVLNAAQRNPAVADLPLIREQADPVAWLQKQLIVSYPGNAEVLEISLRGEDPEVVAKLVNAVCDAYVDGVVNRERNDRLVRVENLEKLRNDTEEKVRQKRTGLRRLTDTLGTGDSQAASLKQRIALESYDLLRREQLNVQLEIMRAEAKLSTLTILAKSGEQQPVPADVIDAAMSGQPEYIAAEKGVEDCESKLWKVEKVVAAGDKTYLAASRRELDAAMAKRDKVRKDLQAKVESGLRRQATKKLQVDLTDVQSQLETAKVHDQHLGGEVAKFSQEAHQIGRSSVDLELMRAEIDNVEKIRNELAEEIEAHKVELISSSRVEVLSRAESPRNQNNLARLRLTGICASVAFVVPMFAICWWDSRRKKVNSVQEVVDALRIHLIGTLPLLPTRIHRRLGDKTTLAAWDRGFGEAVDSVREMLISAGRVRPAQVILVTSALAGEGKTTVATQLAMSFARTGESTILVDFDLRRPASHLPLDAPQGPGLVEVLRNQKTLDQVIAATKSTGLYHLPAGEIDSDCSELLCSRKHLLESLIQQLRSRFKVIIVDSCPVLPVVDTLIVGRFTDVALLSVIRDVSDGDAVLEAHQRLQRVGISVLGAVVTSKGLSAYHSRYPYAAVASQ